MQGANCCKRGSERGARAGGYDTPCCTFTLYYLYPYYIPVVGEMGVVVPSVRDMVGI